MNTYIPQKKNLITGKNEPFTRVPNSIILNSELNHLSKMSYILMSASLPNKGYSPSRHFKLKDARKRLLKQDGSPIGESQFSAATQALREAGFLLQYHNQRTKEWSCKLFFSPLSLEERNSEVIECTSPPPSIFYSPEHKFSMIPTRILQQNYPATETRKKLRYEFLLIFCYLISKTEINDNFGIERISKDLRMSARMVRAGIAALEEWGIILEKPQRNHGYKEFFIFSTIDGCNNDEKNVENSEFSENETNKSGDDISGGENSGGENSGACSKDPSNMNTQKRKTPLFSDSKFENENENDDVENLAEEESDDWFVDLWYDIHRHAKGGQ